MPRNIFNPKSTKPPGKYSRESYDWINDEIMNYQKDKEKYDHPIRPEKALKYEIGDNIFWIMDKIGRKAIDRINKRLNNR